MCGSPKLPPAVDPKEERLKAAGEATQSANAKIVRDRKLRSQQSLLASGVGGNASTAATNSVMAQGKEKLGT